MRRLNFDPALFARTYRDPLAVAFLIVDVLPVFAVIALGWDATPLVFLYWLENLVIGLVTLLRILMAGARSSIAGMGGALFMAAFFTVHYGIFCFGHGQFIVALAGMEANDVPGFLGPVGLVSYALTTGAAMPFFVLAILAVNLAGLARETLEPGGSPGEIGDIMGAPYGRIVILHIGLFAGFAAMAALGQPMIGVLALILLRVVWGVFISVRSRLRTENTAMLKVDVSSGTV